MEAESEREPELVASQNFHQTSTFSEPENQTNCYKKLFWTFIILFWTLFTNL